MYLNYAFCLLVKQLVIDEEQLVVEEQLAIDEEKLDEKQLVVDKCH
jgi:hypothetical protein